MTIHADYEPEADALRVLFYEGADDPRGVTACIEIDDDRRLYLDQDRAVCTLEILSPGKPGRLDLEEMARRGGFSDRLAEVYKAIAEALVSRERAAAA